MTTSTATLGAPSHGGCDESNRTSRREEITVGVACRGRTHQTPFHDQPVRCGIALPHDSGASGTSTRVELTHPKLCTNARISERVAASPSTKKHRTERRFIS